MPILLNLYALDLRLTTLNVDEFLNHRFSIVTHKAERHIGETIMRYNRRLHVWRYLSVVDIGRNINAFNFAGKNGI